MMQMRTTVDLPTPLLRQARKRAGDSGTTLSVLVTDALRAFLSSAREPEARYQVVTFGTAGERFPSPGEIAEALDAEDRESVQGPRSKGG